MCRRCLVEARIQSSGKRDQVLADAGQLLIYQITADTSRWTAAVNAVRESRLVNPRFGPSLADVLNSVRRTGRGA